MSFDALAPYYLRLESILAGNVLQQCRMSFLAEVSECRRALLLGEGPGRFLAELLRANPVVEVVCLEQSPQMIREARRGLERNILNAGRVTFEQTDALTWQPPFGVFDLVVTNFFLDCFRRDELDGLITKVAMGAGAGAQWLLTDFRLPDHGWRRFRARLVLALMYGFFRHVTGIPASRLTPPDEFLAAAGFRRLNRRLANFGLVYSDLWKRGR